MHPTGITNYEVNRLKYRWFAENRRRSEREIDEDFSSLLADPHLVGLDFMAKDPKILLLQTPIIDILHKGKYYRVGQYVIMISRRFTNRSWRVDFRFKNLYPLIYPGHNRDLVHHPHITNCVDDEEFGENVGYFCTEARGFLEKPLKDGRIFDVYPLFLEILTVYPTGMPFHEVTYWPMVGTIEENSHDTRHQSAR